MSRWAEKRWDAIADAAKYGDYLRPKKARYAADVLLGRVKKSDLVKRAREVLPRGGAPVGALAAGERIAQRSRSAKSLSGLPGLSSLCSIAQPDGPRRGARDLAIGLSNLARTAGYPDPIRLEWAMEARGIADLAAGPVSVTQKGVTVTLTLNAENQPEMSVKRGEKALKSIPPDVKKQPKIAALVERQGELKRQSSRVKQSLESAMCRGDTFTGTELKQLFGHPLLRPLLEPLVLVGEGIRGYPTAQGQALEDHNGKLEPIKADEQLRHRPLARSLYIGRLGQVAGRLLPQGARSAVQAGLSGIVCGHPAGAPTGTSRTATPGSR